MSQFIILVNCIFKFHGFYTIWIGDLWKILLEAGLLILDKSLSLKVWNIIGNYAARRATLFITNKCRLRINIFVE